MFNKSAVKDYTAKTDNVLDWKEAYVVGRENIQRLRHVKEVIRISVAPRVMNRYQGGIKSEQHVKEFAGGGGGGGVCVVCACVCVGGVAGWRCVCGGGGGWGRGRGRGKLVFLHEILLLILMQIQITSICLVRVRVLYLIYETSH